MSQSGRKSSGGKSVSMHHINNRKRLSLANIEQIGKPAVVRMGRRAGVVRMCSDVPPTVNVVAKFLLRKMMRNVLICVPHNKRKTVTQLDIEYACRRMGKYPVGVFKH